MRIACGANTFVYDQKVWAFIVDEHHRLANMLATNPALRLTCSLGLSRSKGIYFRRGYEAKTLALFSFARCSLTNNRRFTNTPRGAPYDAAAAGEDQRPSSGGRPSVRLCRRILPDGGGGGGVQQHLRGPRADGGDRFRIRCHRGPTRVGILIRQQSLTRLMRVWRVRLKQKKKQIGIKRTCEGIGHGRQLAGQVEGEASLYLSK
jgi:hypothetical protein